MKRIKEFKSFELNEGIFDDIKSGVKKLISKDKNINSDKSLSKSTDAKLNTMKLQLKGRQPEKVSEGEWKRKLNSFDKAPFTEAEINLFKSLNKTVYKSNVEERSYINLETPGEYDTIIITLFKPIHKVLVITKLDDNWYLISESEPVISYPDEDNEGPNYKYYICDDWEEVLGYLSSII